MTNYLKTPSVQTALLDVYGHGDVIRAKFHSGQVVYLEECEAFTLNCFYFYLK